MNDAQIAARLGEILEDMRELVGGLRAMRQPMTCAECGMMDDGDPGWTMHLDDEGQAVPFCNWCSGEEFSDVS
jgi:hypothetical protein